MPYEEERIQNCTLRINASSEKGDLSSGTAFFIAPGLALTCCHVVQPSDSKPLRIVASWNKNQDVSAELLSTSTALDVAVLGVDIKHHSCLHLGTDIEPGNKLYTYGYPTEKRDGDARLLEYEGGSNKMKLVTLRDSNITEGFSGSPLFNISPNRNNTCGLIKLNRSHNGNIIGAQGVPSREIIAAWSNLFGTDEVVQFIRAKHLIPQIANLKNLAHSNKTYFDPWVAKSKANDFHGRNMVEVIQAWASMLHWSLQAIPASRIESALALLRNSKYQISDGFLLECFLTSASDEKFNIMRYFLLDYRLSAPIDAAIIGFIYLCTGDESLMNLISSEASRERFTSFTETYILNQLISLYSH